MKLLGRPFPSIPAAPQVPVEEAVESLPYLVRRDTRLVTSVISSPRRMSLGANYA